MANRKVILLRYCKTQKGWRRYPVAIGGNGRIRPNYVLVEGRPKEYLEGYYQLRVYQGAKAIYKNVGNHAQDALAAKAKEEQLLVARDAAVAGGAVLVEEGNRVQLRKHATKFVQAAIDRGSTVAADTYRLASDEFLADTGLVYADQVTVEHITAHHLSLKKQGKSARTVHNRHVLLKAFLKDAGVHSHVLDRKPPKYDKTLPEIYDPEDLRDFFAYLTDPYNHLIFEVLLKTGLREQEAMYLEWSDISFPVSTLTIHSKPSLGFRIKE